MRDFFTSKGIRYELVGLHPKSHDMFWIYIKTTELEKAIEEREEELVPKHIVTEDMISSVNYLLNLQYGLGKVDDIDHLGNRRIRAVGELLQNQYRIGLSRLGKSCP